MTILNIRGTHGSGKSTIAAKLILEYPSEQDRAPGVKRPLGYKVKLPKGAGVLYIVGPYLTACGGADGIQPYAATWPRVEEAARMYGHVLFEGALISTSYGSIGQASEAYGKDFVMAFLDTPLDVCIARVNKRRAEAGRLPLTDTKNIASKHATIHRLYSKLLASGSSQHVVSLPHKEPVKHALRLLGVRVNKEPT